MNALIIQVRNHLYIMYQNNWGNGVFSKHKLSKGRELEFGRVHPDAISCADLNIDGKDIILIDLYGK